MILFRFSFPHINDRLKYMNFRRGRLVPLPWLPGNRAERETKRWHSEAGTKVRQEQSGGSGCRQVRAGEHSTRGKEIPNPDGFSGLAPIHGVPNELTFRLIAWLLPLSCKPLGSVVPS